VSTHASASPQPSEATTAIPVAYTDKQLCRDFMDNLPTLTEAMSGMQTVLKDTAPVYVTILQTAQQKFDDLRAKGSENSSVVAELTTLSSSMTRLEDLLANSSWTIETRDAAAIRVLKAGTKLSQTCLPFDAE
jgi:hypothetical protein